MRPQRWNLCCILVLKGDFHFKARLCSRASDPSELFAVRSVWQIEPGNNNNILFLEEASENWRGHQAHYVRLALCFPIFVHRSTFFFHNPRPPSSFFSFTSSSPLLQWLGVVSCCFWNNWLNNRSLTLWRVGLVWECAAYFRGTLWRMSRAHM